jgi:hypothetical protein
MAFDKLREGGSRQEVSNVREIDIGITKSKGAYSAVLVIFGLLFLLGTAAFIYALATGPEATTWGMITVNFLFIMGITQLGVVYSAFMRIARTEWGRAFYRLAEIITLAFSPFAIIIFLLIYIFGREDLIYWISAPSEHHNPWLNSSWLLARNLIALLAFYILSFIYFFMGLLPDINGEAASEGPSWRRGIYKSLLNMKAGKDIERLKRNVYKFAPVVIVAFITANTLIAWDFGMMTNPHWHSTVFPPYFWVGSVHGGVSFLLILSMIVTLFIPLDDYIDVAHVRYMGIMMTGFSLLWLYFFWAQFFVIWFGNMPHEFGPLWRQMYGHYSSTYWTMMFCLLFIPFGTLIFAKVKTSFKAMFVIATLINIGVWLNRYLIVIPTLSEDHKPFISSLIEVPLTIWLISGFLFVLFILFNIFPMVSMWEVREIPKDSHVFTSDHL